MKCAVENSVHCEFLSYSVLSVAPIQFSGFLGSLYHGVLCNKQCRPSKVVWLSGSRKRNHCSCTAAFPYSRFSGKRPKMIENHMPVYICSQFRDPFSTEPWSWEIAYNWRMIELNTHANKRPVFTGFWTPWARLVDSLWRRRPWEEWDWWSWSWYCWWTEICTDHGEYTELHLGIIHSMWKFPWISWITLCFLARTQLVPWICFINGLLFHPFWGKRDR